MTGVLLLGDSDWSKKMTFHQINLSIFSGRLSQLFRIIFVFTIFSLMLSIPCVSAKQNEGQAAIAQTDVHQTFTTETEEKWGIRVVALRSTMAGMMIDFRYKVVDVKKAAQLLDIKKQAYLLVEDTGTKLGVPHSVKIGALRQTTHAKKIKEGFDYFVLFGNPGGRLAKPGDKVAVVIGDFKAEHLVIQ